MNNNKTTFFTKTISLFTLLSLWLGTFASFPVRASITQRENFSSADKMQKNYGKFPILFEENKGQTDKDAKFISRGKGYQLYLTHKEVVFKLQVESEEARTESENSKMKDQRPKTKSDTLKMSFVGANEKPTMTGKNETITKTNYYIGKKRFENLSNFGKVNYQNLYNGIDAVFYGNQENQLEYDFVVSPNIDANQIKLNFDGAKEISTNNNGDLVIKTENTELVQKKPIAYQTINDERKEVTVNYQLDGNKVSFELGEYDKSQTLIIDPVLNYLTYIGGTAFDDVFEVAADNQGNAYISGDTESLNFHGETRQSNDGTAAYVAKINADGTNFVYITILEGKNDDRGSGITVDANNNVFVVGQGTRDFPVTSGAFDTYLGFGNGDGFAAKLDVNGTLDYATYIGGSAGDDLAFDVAVDSAGKAYVTGRTESGVTFPQKNRYQGCGFAISTNSPDAYLTVLNAAGSDITYSTCFGGSVVGTEAAFSVALDSSNNAYITGSTTAGNFPTKNAFQPEKAGGQDGFVAKFNPAASGEASLIYSTFLGGTGTDKGNGIAVNSGNQAVVVGLTGSSNFPLANAFRSTNQINEGFVSVLSSTGTTLVGSSFLGGADQDEAINVALGTNNLIYVTGQTLSNDFPMALPFQATRRGVRDAFVTKLKFGTGVISSSYLGGSGNDFGDGIAVKGNFIYVVGRTASNNLATTTGVIKTTFGGSEDGYVAKILDTAVDSVGVFRPASTFILTQSTTNVIPVNAVLTGGLAGEKGVSGDWNGDEVDTIGSFTNGVWKVRNSNFINNIFTPIITTSFGQAGDLPVVGDWNGDGVDTIGVYRPSVQQFFLTNTLVNPVAADITIQFGATEDLPIAGDWDADGIDTIAVFRPSTGETFFTNQNVFNPSLDFVAFLGLGTDLPFAGDWNGDGKDSLGLYRQSTTEMILSDDNVNLRPIFLFGQSTDQPIAGDWDGIPNP